VLQVKLLGTALHSLCELSTSPVVVDLTTVRLLLGWMTRYQQKQSSLEHAPLMILSLPAPAPPIAIALHVRLPNDVQLNLDDANVETQSTIVQMAGRHPKDPHQSKLRLCNFEGNHSQRFVEWHVNHRARHSLARKPSKAPQRRTQSKRDVRDCA
jgi:hypothetical protein